MKSLIILFSLFISFNLYANDPEPCQCEEAAGQVLLAKGNSAILSAYAYWQMLSLDFYASLSKQFLRSEFLTTEGKTQFQSLARAAKKSQNQLKSLKARIQSSGKITVEQYRSYLQRINQNTHTAVANLDRMTAKIFNGKYAIQSIGTPRSIDSNCYGQSVDMKQKCLEGVERMQACGIYLSDNASLKNDQDNCDGKANRILAICTSENAAGRSFDAFFEINEEIVKAMVACKNHEESGGVSNPSQVEGVGGN